MKKWIVTLLAAILMASVIACEEKGAMEKAGEKVDKAIEDVEKAVKK